MIEYKILEGVPLEDIHPVFVQAFSDYQIQISLPLWKFEGMLRRRGYTAKASMGAFAEGRLAGFILNGVRDYQGARTVYDLGTGVIPEWRKQGLTSEMFQRVLEAVKAEGIEDVLGLRTFLAKLDRIGQGRGGANGVFPGEESWPVSRLRGGGIHQRRCSPPGCQTGAPPPGDWRGFAGGDGPVD